MKSSNKIKNLIAEVKRLVFINKHPAGRHWNFLFGLACIADGIIVVLSLGLLSGGFQLLVTRNQSKSMIEKQKAQRDNKAHKAESSVVITGWYCEGCGQTDKSKQCFGCHKP